MKNIAIKLPIVNPNRRLKYKLTAYSFVFSCIGLFTTVFFTENKALLTLFLVLTIVSGTIMAYIKSYNLEGYIIINNDTITILNKGSNTFLIKDLDKIKIIYRGYEGERYIFNPNAIAPKDGTNNFIKFHHLEKKFTFEILLRERDYHTLHQILSSWKKKGLKFSFRNSLGIPIKI